MNKLNNMMIAVVLGFTSNAIAQESLVEESYVLNQCFECHGKTGKSGRPDTLAIGGMAKSDIIAKLKGYRSQRVPDSVMSRGTHDLNDDDIELVASYFSNLKMAK